MMSFSVSGVTVGFLTGSISLTDILLWVQPYYGYSKVHLAVGFRVGGHWVLWSQQPPGRLLVIPQFTRCSCSLRLWIVPDAMWYYEHRRVTPCRFVDMSVYHVLWNTLSITSTLKTKTAFPERQTVPTINITLLPSCTYLSSGFQTKGSCLT